MAEWRIGASTDHAAGAMRSLWAVGEGPDGGDRYIGGLPAADAALAADALAHAETMTDRANATLTQARTVAETLGRVRHQRDEALRVLGDLAAAVDRRDRPGTVTALADALEVLGRAT